MPALQVIIKDNSLVLTPSHIKAYMLMTLQGLEYLHQHWILHRVRFLTKLLHVVVRLYVASLLHKRSEYVNCYKIELGHFIQPSSSVCSLQFHYVVL